MPGAKFCTECGAALAGEIGTAADGRWQFSAAGAAVLGGLIAGGLAIWAAILSPAPPRPGPGAPASRSAAVGAPAPADLPEAHPKVPVQLPEEVKTFLADLATKAREKPSDAETWLKLARVNARAAQLDASYSSEALTAFRRVLELDPRSPEALQGIADVHYDRSEAKEAVPYYERYLALRPDDASARTDLATMYLHAGDPARAVATYKDVLARNPSFLQAHYNLAVTYHRQGDDQAALAELGIARGLATEDTVRRQIDDMIAALRGEAGPAGGPPAPAPAAPSPFQRAVEQDLRGHPILGPRVVRLVWGAPGSGRVLVQNFPMEAMPPEVRDKFRSRLAAQLRTASGAHPVEGPVRLEIVDVSSGRVMETVTP